MNTFKNENGKMCIRDSAQDLFFLCLQAVDKPADISADLFQIRLFLSLIHI